MIRLACDETEAEIALDGAELRAWSVGGTELIWNPDPDIWEASAPLLFPVVGWTRDGKIEVDGRSYPLGVHGFARHMPFRVLEQWPTHARLALVSSEATRALYPFDWSLEVAYALDDKGIETRITVRNEGDRPMPYACGLHPGFRWPFAGGHQADYMVTFAEREAASVPVISADGLFTGQSRHLPIDGRRLALSSELLEREALCFLDARSHGLRFGRRSGAAIDITLDNFPHIALWSRPHGRFLSIEAWTGHGDHVGAQSDLFRKPSMRHLPPNAIASHAAKYSYVPPHLLFR